MMKNFTLKIGKYILCLLFSFGQALDVLFDYFFYFIFHANVSQFSAYCFERASYLRSILTKTLCFVEEKILLSYRFIDNNNVFFFFFSSWRSHKFFFDSIFIYSCTSTSLPLHVSPKFKFFVDHTVFGKNKIPIRKYVEDFSTSFFFLIFQILLA